MKIIKISGAGFNCGLFSLSLGISLELLRQSKQSATIPSWISELRPHDVSPSSPRAHHIGQRLRLLLADSMRNGRRLKTQCYELICQEWCQPHASFEFELEAFYRSVTIQAIKRDIMNEFRRQPDAENDRLRELINRHWEAIYAAYIEYVQNNAIFLSISELNCLAEAWGISLIYSQDEGRSFVDINPSQRNETIRLHFSNHHWEVIIDETEWEPALLKSLSINLQPLPQIYPIQPPFFFRSSKSENRTYQQTPLLLNDPTSNENLRTSLTKGQSTLMARLQEKRQHLLSRITENQSIQVNPHFSAQRFCTKGQDLIKALRTLSAQRDALIEKATGLEDILQEELHMNKGWDMEDFLSGKLATHLLSDMTANDHIAKIQIGSHADAQELASLQTKIQNLEKSITSCELERSTYLQERQGFEQSKCEAEKEKNKQQLKKANLEQTKAEKQQTKTALQLIIDSQKETLVQSTIKCSQAMAEINAQFMIDINMSCNIDDDMSLNWIKINETEVATPDSDFSFNAALVLIDPQNGAIIERSHFTFLHPLFRTLEDKTNRIHTLFGNKEYIVAMIMIYSSSFYSDFFTTIRDELFKAIRNSGSTQIDQDDLAAWSFIRIPNLPEPIVSEKVLLKSDTASQKTLTHHWNTKDRLEPIETAFSKEKNQLEKTINEARSQLETLQGELTQFIADIQVCQNQIEANQQSIVITTAEIKKLTTQISQLDSSIATRRDHLSHYKKRCEQLEGKENGDLPEQSATLDAPKIDAEKTQDLQRELAETRIKIQQINAELTQLAGHYRRLIHPDLDRSPYPLITAVLNPQEEILRTCLERGSDPNLTDKNGWTALHHALMHCVDLNTLEKHTIQYLLHFKAKITIPNHQNHYPYQYTLNEDVRYFLLRSALTIAIVQEDADALAEVLEQSKTVLPLIAMGVYEEVYQKLNAAVENTHALAYVAQNSEHIEIWDLLLTYTPIEELDKQRETLLETLLRLQEKEDKSHSGRALMLAHLTLSSTNSNEPDTKGLTL